MTKVGVLTSSHKAFDTRIFHKQCKSLVQNGYDVTLIVPHSSDDCIDGIKIKALTPTSARLARMTSIVWQLYRQALSLDADIYHFHDPPLIGVGLLLRLKGKKVIYDVHEDMPATLLGRHYLPKKLRKTLAWIVEKIEKFSLAHFSAIIAATPFIAERFRHPRTPCVVVQNFAFLKTADANDDAVWNQRPNAVAYVGPFTEGRGIRQMLKAIEIVAEESPITLRLAGRFSHTALEREIVQLPVWKLVQFDGWIKLEEVKNLLQQVRAGLVLIQPEPRYQVSYPIKMFEYMAAGLPVIASDFPLWREIIEEAKCGLLVDPNDPKAIANAIQFLMTNEQVSQEMGRCGREAIIQRYNWEQEESKMLKLYETLIKT